MKKLILTIILLGVLIGSNACASAIVDCVTHNGWNQNFMYSTQMEDGYYRCYSDEDETLYLSFDGVGAGLGIGREAFKMLFLGPGLPNGNFYGLRVQAAAVVGANVMTLAGARGFIQVIGLDFGVGVDVSAVKVRIEKEAQLVRRYKKEAESQN